MTLRERFLPALNIGFYIPPLSAAISKLVSSIIPMAPLRQRRLVLCTMQVFFRAYPVLNLEVPEQPGDLLNGQFFCEDDRNQSYGLSAPSIINDRP
jgi:hypothetical protein